MIYFGTRLSENISRREPEGYLICLNVPVARTGMQEYLAEELGTDPAEGRVVPVWRPEEEVFSKACMASFEGMPVTDDHPSFSEGVTAENIRYLQKGHAHNIRRGAGKEEDLLLADLIITDPGLAEEILRGKREISCGYNYVLSREDGRYVQREIRGNHVAVVDAGRAGPRVSIRDHAGKRNGKENGKQNMKRDMERTERSEMSMKKDSGMNGTDRRTGAADSRNRMAGRMARIMARMARDGETEELAEVIAELMEPETAEEILPEAPGIAEAVEEILETGTGGEKEAETNAPVVPVVEAGAEAPAKTVEVAVPEDRQITIDSIGEILELLRQIVGLMTPAADCGTAKDAAGECGEETGDEDPAEAAAEALAEAVTGAVEAAAGGQEPEPAGDPMAALVAEVLEEAVTAGEAESAVEAVSELMAPGDAGLPEIPEEDETESLVIEPEKEVPSDRTADALRAAMKTFRPILKSMAPEARRKAVAKIAANLKANDKLRAAKAGAGKDGEQKGEDAYARLRGVTNRRLVTEPTGELGKKIMAERNPHYAGKA